LSVLLSQALPTGGNEIMKKYSSFILLIFMLTTLSLIITAQSPDHSKELQVEPITFKSNKGEIVVAEKCYFYVPENRQKKSTKPLRLGFVRFKSTNPNPGYPIVYLAGGPGGSGTGAARGKRFALFMALREISDVIAFDQRGTGSSNSISYGPANLEYRQTTPLQWDAFLAAIKKQLNTNLDYWKSKGIDIDAYNTNESADDLEALRNILKVKKLNLWGISYGTHLAFAMIKRHPSSIDKLILASLEGPDHTVKLPELSQKHLERLNDAIKEDPEAAKKYPDLLRTMKIVLDKLQVNPLVVEVINSETNQKEKIGIGKLDVQLFTVFWLAKNPRELGMLPYFYYRMAEGDFSQVGRYILFLKKVMTRKTLMSLTMDAASGVSKERWQKIKEQAPSALMERTHDFPFPDINQTLGVKDLGDNFRKPFKTDIPALLISGTLDGRTYIESQKEVASWFTKGIHIIIENAGHDLFFSSPKIKDYMLDFLKGKPITVTKLKAPPIKFL
jgi:pimeloyl-ACP methyl ester carboxylesterase